MAPMMAPAESAVSAVPASVTQPVTPEPAANVSAVAVAAEPIPVAAAVAPVNSMPAVQSFELPLGELAAVAEGSGLSWVNTDPAKVAAVQAAIAAESKPVHIPRERPPAPVLDEGPLVLVETRRDLRDLALPFETSKPGA